LIEDIKMKLRQLNPEFKEETTLLKNVKCGEVFRFASIEFADAMNESLFYMKTNDPVVENRVQIVNVYNGERLKRDDSHVVITHNAVISIQPNPYAEVKV